MTLAPLPKLQELLRLSLKKSGLDARGATQSPQQAYQSQHQFSFDRRLRVVVRSDGHFECRIVPGIFERADDGFCSQAMTKRVSTRSLLALFGDKACVLTRIAAVGLGLPGGAHPASRPTIGFVSLLGCPLAEYFSLRSAGFSIFPAAAASIAWVLAQRRAAIGRGSIPLSSHQARSLPRRCSSRWCSLQMGTVN